MNFTKIFYGISTFFIFLILFLYFFHKLPLDITNSDLGRHLLLGKIIVITENVPKINLLSYTNTNFPFINSHWFSEVVFYLWYSVLGFNGLIILSVLIITGAFSAVFIFAAKKFNIFAALLISLLYLQVLAERTEVRPELFSFLLVSLFITILYKYRERYTKWIYLLIPLELLWVNFHIYFFVGIGVLFIFLFDSYFIKKDAINSKQFLTLVYVTTASWLVTLCNPNFINGAVFPLFVLNNYGIVVEENLNFFTVIQTSSDSMLYLFFISSVFLWITLLISIKKCML